MKNEALNKAIESITPEIDQKVREYVEDVKKLASAEQVASGPGWFVLHISTPKVHKPYLLYIDNGKGVYHSGGDYFRLDAAIEEGREYTIMDEGTEEYCTCEKYNYPPDVCPFADEIHNSQEECTCCPFCRHDCWMNV